jgi:cholesterol transport system auxiliary component
MRTIHRSVLLFVLPLLAGSFSACSLLPPRAHVPTTYDFGPSPKLATTPPLAGLVFLGFRAVPWLSGTGIHYRLLYRQAQELRRYGGKTWLASPGSLMASRLASEFAVLGLPSRPRYTLSLRLVTFEQDFSSPKSADDRLGVIAVLRRPLRADWQVSHDFRLTRKTPPTAGGAIRGFAVLDDRFNRQLIRWIEREINGRGTGKPSAFDDVDRKPPA